MTNNIHGTQAWAAEHNFSNVFFFLEESVNMSTVGNYDSSLRQK